MPILIARPARVEAAGNKPKLIDGYFGLPAFSLEAAHRDS